MTQKIIFVTGHHRGGTHEFSEHLEKIEALPLIMEDLYMFDDMKILDMLLLGQTYHWGKNGKEIIYHPEYVEKGFILQCPGLACHCADLAKIGEVYWCNRDPQGVAASIAYGGFNNMLWDIMKSFKAKFPDDPIWSELIYSDRDDPHSGFLGYAYLLTKVKEYFFDKYFKSIVRQVVKLEDQAYYDFSKTSLATRPLTAQKLQRITKVETLNESLCVRQDPGK